MAEEAVLQQGLAGLTRTMSMHMDKINKSNVSFKEAAAQHNRNVSGIIKDVFSSVAGQRRELSEVNDNLEESFSSIRQGFQSNARATESVSDSMQQVLSVQYKTLSELSQLNRNMNFLVNNTSDGILTKIFGTALTNIFGTNFNSLTSAFKLAFPLGIAGGAAYMAGQGAGQTDTSALTNYTAEEKTAKASAEKYLGRPMGDSEWKELVKATHAEAGQKNQTEVAMVMATMLNRARDKNKSVSEILREPSQFQAVTGTRFNPNPSSAFVQGPGEQRANQIYGAAANILNQVSKQQTKFTAASSAAYGPGTSKRYREELIAAGGSTVGASVFNTAAPSVSGGAVTPSSTTVNNTTNISQEADPGRMRPEAPGVTGPGGKSSELQTKSGTDTQHLQPDIMSKFKSIQSQAGMGLTVTSGFRDPQHNAAVGGAKNSAHTRGNAVDVTFPGGVAETNKLIEVASKAGIGGIGVYRPGVLHFDTEGKRAWGPNYHSDSIPQWALPAINAHLSGKTPSSGSSQTTPSTEGGQITPSSSGGESGAPQSAEYRPENFMQYAQEQLKLEEQTAAGIMGGISPMSSIGGMGSMAAALGPLMQAFSQESSEAMKLSPQIGQQVQLTPEVANKLQAVAIQEKIAQSMELKPPEPERRETEASQFMQSPERHYPAGSYSEYNTDNHIHPDWGNAIYYTYGDLTGPNGGNIKTHF